MNKLLNFYYLVKHELREKLAIAFASFFVRIYCLILATLNLFIWLGSYYIAKSVGAAQIALHYSVGFGIDYYSDTEKIYIIPLLGLLIALLNFSLYAIIGGYKDKNFIGHILFAGAIVANTILLISAFSIYIINF